MRCVAGLCVAGLAACAGVPPASPAAGAASVPPSSFTGTRWVGAMPEATDHHAIPRLEFVGQGRLSGYTGCNMLSGTWTLEGSEVRVGALVTTKRLCMGPEQQTERRLLAAMREGARGRRAGDRLVFTGPGGERFEFVEAAAT